MGKNVEYTQEFRGRPPGLIPLYTTVAGHDGKKGSCLIIVPSRHGYYEGKAGGRVTIFSQSYQARIFLIKGGYMIFKIKRFMQYTEEAVIEADDWDKLSEFLSQGDIEYDRNEDDTFVDQEVVMLTNEPKKQ